MKEVKFLTEKSQDKEKNLSFKEQILKDLAGEKEEQTPSSTSQSERTLLLQKKQQLRRTLKLDRLR